ncbi:MAG: UbiD family decarboxylase [Saprospiraceae bacterium]|nr:UbiD family decarboxylase [Saprospiraceae bacterium]
MYKNLRETVIDLEKHQMLIRVKSEVDGDLEVAEIHRRIFDKKGPAILFEKVKGSPFQAVSNIYGTYERTDFLFRKTYDKIKKVIELKADPSRFLKSPLKYLGAPFTALTALPMRSYFNKPVAYGTTQISKLPLIKSWPMDGGAFVTMPQVFTMAPGVQNIMQSNLGMYRIQLSGNDYQLDEEIGLHYQIHRGIGNHHTLYNESDEPFRCSIFVGGPPAHAFSAIMPMPETITELTFAGMLAGRRFRYFKDDQGHIVSSDADFVITGTIQKDRKMPEGPFGDHIGYYSLQHDFPVMKVDRVYHRKDALWHFTVVGRPPQEDSSFGYLIHNLVEDLTPGEFPGLVSINAVDAAGVHPLLLAVGKERYMPFREKAPEEILTIANRILGSGQTSLAKYLFIAAEDDDPKISAHHINPFFQHFLQRVDWRRDLHFQTKTTIDTLDYSGSGWNAGSKLVIACRGAIKRSLWKEINLERSLPEVKAAFFAMPGVWMLSYKKWVSQQQAEFEIQELVEHLSTISLEGIPMIILCDDAEFGAATLNNFLWVTFTRSNPSHDIYGVGAFSEHKHWGCNGSLIIDARVKNHHAPELIPDAKVASKVDKMFAKGGDLHGWS